MGSRARSPKGRRSCGGASGSTVPGPYQIQAAINAVHSDAPCAEATDWRAILQLYDQLYALTPTPIVALNRAVARRRGRRRRPPRSRPIEPLDLQHYHLFHAIRADLLGRAGRRSEALAAYDAAIARAENGAERAFLERKRDGVSVTQEPQ